MKSSFRPTNPGDLSAVCQFLQRAFHASPDAPFLDPAIMAWKYWEPRHDWDGPRAYVLERDGAIVAHAGIWPVTFHAGEVRGVHMIDWASATESPGAGLALVQKLAALFDFIYAIGGTEMTRKALPAFGFTEHGRQWNAASPLRPWRQMLTHQHRNWKLAPRLARNAAWALTKASRGLAGEWKSEEISVAAIPEEPYAGFSPRPPGFFEYLLRCPAGQVRLYGMSGERGPEGHFAIGLIRGQARLAGVWLRNPGRDTWKAAFGQAREVARGLSGACEIVAAGTVGPSGEGAVLAGFKMIQDAPVYLLNRKGKLDLSRDFQFQLSDNDVFFLDSGGTSYWT
jgi:hypothetical protein